MFTVKLTALSREDGQPVTKVDLTRGKELLLDYNNEVTVSSVSQQSEDIQPDGMFYLYFCLTHSSVISLICCIYSKQQKEEKEH